MSYVVLARKYRPLRFADMIGQEHIGRTLGNAITQNRVHHAYLFAGARGLGKTTTARIFAKALVCEKGPAPEPCNTCAQCLAVTEGRSVDVIEIDGASNNSVENIRSLREQVNYLPQTARRKVYVIDEVHMLSTSAFNALLKTLEEPPAHVNFVFATTEPHKVLATILSRVSRLDFRRVSIAETVAHLTDILAREQLGVDPAGLRLIARAAGGSVRDAMTLLDQVLAFAADPKQVGELEARAVLGQADRTAVGSLVDAVLARDPDLVLERFDGLAAAGHDLSVLSLQMLEDLRDLTIVRACKSREMFVDATDDELAELERRAAVVDVATLGQTFDRLWRVVDRLPMARSQRLVLEMGLLGLAQREPLVPLGDLVERLQSMAGGDGGSAGGSAGGGVAAARDGRGPSRAPAGRTGRQADASLSDARDDEAPWSDEPREASRTVSEPRRAPESSTQASASSASGAPTFSSSQNAAPQSATPQSAAPQSAAPQSAAPQSTVSRTAAPQPASSPTPAPPRLDDDASPFSRGLWELAQRNGVLAGGEAQQTSEPRDSSTDRSPPSDPSPSSNGARTNGVRTSDDSRATNGARSNDDARPINGAHASAPDHDPRDDDDASLASIATTATIAPDDDALPTLEAGDDDLPDLAMFQEWLNLVAAVRETDVSASALLGDVGLVQLGDGSLRVAAPRGGFAHSGLTAGDLRARVEQAARELTGATVVIELVDAVAVLPERPSIVLVDRRRRDRLAAAVAREATEHPAIAALVRDFDAKIAATRPLSS